MNRLYKEIKVWRRISNKEAVKYSCFELLDENKFCVQSIDHYYLTSDNSEFVEFDK